MVVAWGGRRCVGVTGGAGEACARRCHATRTATAPGAGGGARAATAGRREARRPAGRGATERTEAARGHEPAFRRGLSEAAVPR
eukprot:COSAG02_NODE_2048_length_10009_cov_34.602321_2_plen_84_part_00